MFGWRRASNRMRRFQKVYLSMARKWGKSTFAAAVALLLMVFDNPFEPGAEIYAVATKEQQARVVHSEAKRMVAQSQTLKRKLKVLDKSIDYPAANSSFLVIGGDGYSSDGQNLHGAIIDELHAWRGQHRDLLEKLTTAGGARLQPLWITITTAGDDKSQIWMEEEAYAVKTVESVLTGQVIDDQQFALICTIDADDDPFDENVWIKANPHIGETVTMDYARGMATEARGKPAAMSKFLRYVCNRKTASSERAITPELWAGGGQEPEPIEGRTGYGAFDLGRTNDWAARVAVFPRSDDPDAVLDVAVKCWTCEGTSLPLHREPYASFVRDGTLVVCDGGEIDFGEIEDDTVDFANRCFVRSWAFDPTFAGPFAQRLERLYGMEIFAFTQSARFYTAPLRELLKMLAQRRIAHGNDACLAWQAQNLTIRRNPKDEWMPEKLGGDLKIDGMVALLMALSEYLYHGAQKCSNDSAVMLL
ncbi:MAG: hypothetical protein KIS87_13555 [Phycisphaeraceae bacterium]|nr:hypothetical protein [Phycisphaeraceae bacterium]